VISLNNPTHESGLDLAGIIDLYSRAVVGWGMSRTLDGKLAADALNMAINRSGSGSQILHSDRGSTYSTADYRALLGQHLIRQSASSKEGC
jgi:putative transposase